MFASRLLDYLRCPHAASPATAADLSPAASVDLGELLSESEIDRIADEMDEVSAQPFTCVPSEEFAPLRVECRSLAGTIKQLELPTGATAYDLRQALEPHRQALELIGGAALFCDGVELDDAAVLPVANPTIVHIIEPAPVSLGGAEAGAKSSGARSAVWGTVAVLVGLLGLLTALGTVHHRTAPTPRPELRFTSLSLGAPRARLPLPAPPPRNATASSWLQWGHDEAAADDCKAGRAAPTPGERSPPSHSSLLSMRAKRPLLPALVVAALSQGALVPTNEVDVAPPANAGDDNRRVADAASSAWKAALAQAREKALVTWKATVDATKQLGRRTSDVFWTTLQMLLMLVRRQLHQRKKATPA